VRFQDGSTDRKFDHRIDCKAGDHSPRPHSRLNARLRQVAIATCLALWLPLPALSAKLVEVRVGRHTGYTRVVLQTDAPVEYTLTRSKSGNVRIELAADASPRRLASKSDVLREVIVENTAEGALARLRLHRPDVAVKEMVLKSPPRIVLDLTPGVAQPAVAAAETPAPKPVAVAPAPKAEAKPAPVAVKEQPKPDAVDASASASAKEARASAPAKEARASAPAKEVVASAPAKETVASASTKEVDGAAATGAATGGRLADSKAASPPEPKSAAPAEPKQADAKPSGKPEEAKVADAAEKQDAAAAKLAESGSTGEVVDPATEGVAKAAPVADRGRLREMPKPPPARSAEPAEPAPTPGALAFLPAPFNDPLVLGGITGLLVLVAALVAVRRRGADRAEEELGSPFASSEPFSAPESPQQTAASFDIPVPAEELADGDLPGIPGQPLAAGSGEGMAQAAAGFEEGDSLFAGEAEAEAEEEKETDARAFAPAPIVDMGAAEAPALGGDVMRVVEELERRMGQMETRLEEVVDAKERLERQVSAQTEELRVQRAAIARTQRVLRNVSRPEDEATEPAPKV